ncbi:Protein of unknown function [Gryllus bimaculatus]|nr:Protein of unknown function [Gryllus bimaculatus]
MSTVVMSSSTLYDFGDMLYKGHPEGPNNKNSNSNNANNNNNNVTNNNHTNNNNHQHHHSSSGGGGQHSQRGSPSSPGAMGVAAATNLNSAAALQQKEYVQCERLLHLQCIKDFPYFQASCLDLWQNYVNFYTYKI